MIEFYIVGLICVIIASLYKHFKFALEFAFLILTIFLSIRYQFGSDYPEYLRHFEIANSGSLSDALDTEKYVEDGWVILCRLLNPIGFFGMVIVLTVFEHFVLYKFIKKHVPRKWYWLAVFSYIFSTTLCLTGASMMRQFLAMCICLIAFDLALEKKNVIWALLLGFLATTFHTSAYLCLPFCFIGYVKDIKFSKEQMALTIFVLLILFFAAGALREYLQYFVENSVFSAYESRFVEEETQTQIGVSTFVNYIVFFLILFMQKTQDYANRKLVIIFLWYIIIQSFSVVSPLINRMGFYFYILFPVCFSNAVNKIKKEDFSIIILAIFVVVRLYNCYSFITSPGWGRTFLVYRTIFSVGGWM